MPGMYKNDFDIAGFSVVEQKDLITGANIKQGNRHELQSSGVHSNGFSLIRKLIVDKVLDPKKIGSKPLISLLMTLQKFT